MKTPVRLLSLLIFFIAGLFLLPSVLAQPKSLVITPMFADRGNVRTEDDLVRPVRRPTVCLVLSGGGSRGIAHVGVLALMLSTTAMTWNVIYNLIFDRLWPLASVPRTLKVRGLHALGFEAGLVLVGVPLAAWMLDISLLQAFVLDIGFFLFFLPYAFVYNWAYDGLRELWVGRRAARV